MAVLEAMGLTDLRARMDHTDNQDQITKVKYSLNYNLFDSFHTSHLGGYGSQGTGESQGSGGSQGTGGTPVYEVAQPGNQLKHFVGFQF